MTTTTHEQLCTQDPDDESVILLTAELDLLGIDHSEARCWCSLLALIETETARLAAA